MNRLEQVKCRSRSREPLGASNELRLPRPPSLHEALGSNLGFGDNPFSWVDTKYKILHLSPQERSPAGPPGFSVLSLSRVKELGLTPDWC